MTIPETPEGISLPAKNQIEALVQLLKKGRRLRNSSKHPWPSQATYVIKIIDYGVSDHMTNTCTIMTYYTKLLISKYVNLADDTSNKITGK